MTNNDSVDKLKRFVRRTGFYSYLVHRRYLRELKQWEDAHHPVPPPSAVKQRALLAYAEVYNLHVFVETGTCFGTTVEAVKPFFEKIYTIELSSKLYEQALKRFAFNAHVNVINGDSGKELGVVMKSIDQPTLFWLDAHYSAGVTARGAKDTPILDELAHILNSPDRRHVILIDDLHNFGVDPSYPSIEQLTAFVQSRRAGLRIEVRNNIIRIVPG